MTSSRVLGCSWLWAGLKINRFNPNAKARTLAKGLADETEQCCRNETDGPIDAMVTMGKEAGRGQKLSLEGVDLT